MRRSLTVLVAALGIACVPVFASPAVGASGGDPNPGSAGAPDLATPAASCDTVRYGGRSYVLSKKGVRCAFAKRWVRRLNRSQGRNKPRGFKCTSGSKFRTGGQCVRGSRFFIWHPGD